MITPEECRKLDETNEKKLDELEKEIDKSIKENHGDHPWEEAMLDTELSIKTRDTLAKKYLNVGWNYVYHQTSSENGERPGLTSFVLSDTPVSYFENNKWHKWYKDRRR